MKNDECLSNRYVSSKDIGNLLFDIFFVKQNLKPFQSLTDLLISVIF